MHQLTIIRALLISFVLIVITAVLLYTSGRSLICPCGTVKLFDIARKAGQDSQHIFDWYSFTHVLHGLLIYLGIWLVGRGRVPFALGLILAVLIEGGWELFENGPYVIDRYQAQGISANYVGDSVINSVGDLFSMSLGFFLAWRLPVWASVAVFIGVEAGMAWQLRDNLFLSALSLAYPIDWIAQWQEAAK